MLTQCPQCAARFRVLEEQLQAAKGKVRCGHCMTVFNALANLVSDEGVEPSPGKAEKPEKVGTGSNHGGGADHLVRAMEKQKHVKKESEPKLAAAEPASAMTTAEDTLSDELSAISPQETPLSEEEDLVFQDNPDEDKSESGYTGSSLSDNQLSDSFRELETGDNQYLFGDDDEEEPISTDESWAEAMLQEDQPRPAAPPTKQEPTFSLAPDPEAAGAFKPVPSRSDHSLRAEPRAGYEQYRPTPIQVRAGGQSESAFQPRKAILGTVIFFLIIGLMVQLSWYHYDKLARYESVRPVYVTICDQLNALRIHCQLPALVDLERIRSENLIVRSHPLASNALIIDAVVFNDASFPQPYPAINLSFADINGNTVARRVFQPAEYLPKDADLPEQLPSRTPLRISLELRDPGKEAVNYTISFLSAQTDSGPESQP